MAVVPTPEPIVQAPVAAPAQPVPIQTVAQPVMSLAQEPIAKAEVKQEEIIKKEEPVSAPADDLNDLNINGQTVSVNDLPTISASSMDYEESM